MKEDKLSFLTTARSIEDVPFDRITPNKKHDWLDQADGDWDDFLPLADPTKGPGDKAGRVWAIFRLSSNGVKTQRNDWVWSADRRSLSIKVKTLIDTYEALRTRRPGADGASIKWDAVLDAALKRGAVIQYDQDCEIPAVFRPFSSAWLYFNKLLNGSTPMPTAATALTAQLQAELERLGHPED